MTIRSDAGTTRHVPDPSRRRRALALKLSALAAAAAALFPSEARAEAPFAGGGGIYVSFTFGDELGVGYGAEGFFTGLAKGGGGCNSDGGAGVGGLIQVGGINASTFRYVVAVHGGGQFDDETSVGLDGELGLAGHLGHGAELGIHTGLLLQGPFVMDWFVRGEWLLDEYSAGIGARMMPTFGIPEGCIIGRPWRGPDGRVALGSAELGPEGEHPTDAKRRFVEHEWLAREWADDAQAEAASVPAFLQLAADLLAHDAPDDLVEAALSAAEDEIRHARLCARLASRWSGRRVTPALPNAPLRPPLLGELGVARLAVESWVDGSLGEGAAAARARSAAGLATERAAAAAQRRIALDEARHAELGFRVLTWALERGGAPIAERVRELRDVEPAAPGTWLPREAAVHGRLAHEDAARVHDQHAAIARARLDRLLVG
jgi:hypothetical protein